MWGRMKQVQGSEHNSPVVQAVDGNTSEMTFRDRIPLEEGNMTGSSVPVVGA